MVVDAPGRRAVPSDADPSTTRTESGTPSASRRSGIVREPSLRTVTATVTRSPSAGSVGVIDRCIDTSAAGGTATRS